MALIGDLQDAVRKIRDEVGGAVVGIADHWARGSGVVTAPGQVLTNAHNVRGEQVTVSFTDGRTERGRIAGADADGDVALVSVDTGEAAPVEWAPSADVDIGTAVFALANPGGQGLRVTFGLISGTNRSFRGPRGRRIAGSIEHAAPLLPGSSGGPVVDVDGRLLGINTNRLGEGFYLAIPAGAELKRTIEALGRGEAPARPRLGIAVAPSHVARRLRRAVGLPEAEGLLVRAVEEGGPAAAAGLQQGDLIVAAGGRTIAGADDLYEVLESAGAGASVELEVLRGTEERTMTASLDGSG